MLRFSLLGAFNTSVNRILNLQADTYKTQNQISSGRKILVPSDDPVAAARIIQLNAEQSQVDQYLNNILNANNRLGLEETQINEVQNILFRLREITVNAGNGTLGQSERKGLAAEVSSRLDQLVDLANTRDSSGEYIFSGFSGSTKPFVDVGSGNYVYQGDEGQRSVSIAITTKVPISDSGSEVFEDIEAAQNGFFSRPNLSNTGGATISPGLVTDQAVYNASYPEDYSIVFAVPANTYSVREKGTGNVIAGPTAYTPGQPIDVDLTALRGFKVTISGTPANGDNFQIESTPKQSLLTTVGRLVEGLTTISDAVIDRPKLDALIADTLTNLDFAETRMSEVRSKIGARFNVLDGIKDLQDGIKEINSKVLSDIRDLDYAEALSRLSQQSLTLEASQQSYAKISTLSLFNFLR